MENIRCFFNNSLVSNFFIQHENQILQSLEKRVLLVAMGIFAILSTIFLTIYYWRNRVASKQEPKEESDQKISDTPVASPRAIPIKSEEPEVNPVNSNKILAQVCQELDQAPHMFPNIHMKIPGVKDDLRRTYHREIERLNNFLIEQLKGPVEIDVAYVCIGHGSVAEQIWPGFTFEALQSGKKVETYLFENGWKYSPSFAVKDFEAEYIEYHDHLKADPDEKTMQNINKLSVKQFVCGFPETQLEDDCYEESMDDQTQKIYPLLGNIYWKNRQQAISVLDNFNQYIEKILREGKTVVLGEHRGALSINKGISLLYNQMVEKYPGQIYFLWGWGKCNLMTCQPLKTGDLDPHKHSLPWTYHEKLSTTTLNFLKDDSLAKDKTS